MSLSVRYTPKEEEAFVGVVGQNKKQEFVRGIHIYSATMRIYKLWQQSYCMSAALSGRFFGCSCSRTAMFSSFPSLRARKKSSLYSSVDSEHYSSLVKAVVSARMSSQTPESIENEDQWLYGSIVKPKLQACRALKNPWPLLNDAKRVFDAKNVEDGQSVTRISLQIGSDRTSIPSVTKILQKTMSAQQAFYLQRWKKRKIAELGVEGFNEYSNCRPQFSSVVSFHPFNAKF